MLDAIISRSRNLLACTRSFLREAHTYSRQDRGLYGKTHKQYGNSISESHRKTQRVWLPNVHSHTIFSGTLNRPLTLRITASVWRTIQNARYGGSIDAYLTSDSKGVQRGLGQRGMQLRNEILNRRLKSARRQSLPNARKRAGQAATQEKVAPSNAEVPAEVKQAAQMEGLATGM